MNADGMTTNPGVVTKLAQVDKWITTDGQIFSDEQQAFIHERDTMIEQFVTVFKYDAATQSVIEGFVKRNYIALYDLIGKSIILRHQEGEKRE